MGLAWRVRLRLRSAGSWVRTSPLLRIISHRARLLDLPASAFSLQPAFLRGTRRPCRRPRLGRLCSPANQIEQARPGIFAIARLGTVAVRDDNQPSISGDAPSGDMAQAAAHVIGERTACFQCEAQLHCTSDLVDVLPSRSGGADEGFLDVPFVQEDGGRDANSAIWSGHVCSMRTDELYGAAHNTNAPTRCCRLNATSRSAASFRHYRLLQTVPSEARVGPDFPRRFFRSEQPKTSPRRNLKLNEGTVRKDRFN